MVINRYVVFDEEFMLNHIIRTNVSASKLGTSNNEVIYVDINSLPLRNVHIVHDLQAKSKSNIEMHYEPKDSGGVHDCSLVRDKEHRQIKSAARYGYEHLLVYAFLTSCVDLFTFYGVISI